MAWARVDDGWWSHPKVMGLSLAASGLWARALSWSCHQRRDHVPSRFLTAVGADDDLAFELVDAGLWHPNGDGWVIHDWEEYQEQSLSEKRAEAGRKGGVASGKARREANTKQTDVASEADGEAGTRPVPSRPDQKSITDSFEQFWDAYPKRDGKKRGKTKALEQWRKLTEGARERAARNVENFARAAAHPDVFCPIPDAQRWLRDREFDEWDEPARPGDTGQRAGPTACEGCNQFSGHRFDCPRDPANAKEAS